MHTSLVWSESDWLHSHRVSIRSAFLFSSVVHSATDGTTGSGTGNQHSRELLSSQLKITIRHLFVRLDDWCTALREHTNSEQSRPAPDAHTRSTSIDKLPRETHEASRRCALDFYFILWTLTCNPAKVIYLITTSQRK